MIFHGLKKLKKKFNFKKKSSFQERIFIAFKGSTQNFMISQNKNTN